jgi:phosphate transport system substrate-binding protein
MHAQRLLPFGLLLAGLAGCGTPHQPADLDTVSTAPLTGAIAIDGSNTLLPVSQAIVAGFTRDNPQVQVALAGAGSVAGFRRFCNGEIDIADASRPIDRDEIAACAGNGIQFIELPVGFDALTVVVNVRNTFVDCLTVDELKRLWAPQAQGVVKTWSQVRAGLPPAPVALFGPGTDSGTFDYFTLAIVGASGRARADYTKDSDDNALAAGVSRDANALGFFGYAYYASHRDTLKALSIDGGRGCVAPSAEAVHANTYQPLSRPLFIYVKKASVARSEVRALVRAYVDPAATQIVKRVGYVPMPLATTLHVAQRFEDGSTGSVFGGSGAVLGVTADAFKDDDTLKNALVR